MRVKTLKKEYLYKVEDLPNFKVDGSIRGMKDLYYGKDALLVRCDGYIYNVSRHPDIYYLLAD